MAEPATALEFNKLIVSTLLAVRDAFLSITFMMFFLIIAAISAFIPLSWWEWVKMPCVGKVCQEYREIALLAFGISLIILIIRFVRDIILYVRDIWCKCREESRFADLMENLPPVEMKALCNAYHNGGKYSPPSCYAEIESLKKKRLIVVSPESGSFGGQEFTLSDKTYAYIKKHSDFFAKRGIEPDPPEEDKVPFCAVV